MADAIKGGAVTVKEMVLLMDLGVEKEIYTCDGPSWADPFTPGRASSTHRKISFPPSPDQIV